MLWLLSMSRAKVAGHSLVADEIDGLCDAVFLDGEVSRGQTADEPALPVVDARLEQDTRDLRDLGDFERLEDDAVATLVPLAVFDLDGQLTTLERVLVGPLHRVRRPIVVGLEQRASRRRSGRAERGAWRALNLRDDTDGATHAAGASERRSNANGQIGITAEDAVAAAVAMRTPDVRAATQPKRDSSHTQ